MEIFCGLIKGRHKVPDTVTDYVFSADIPQSNICDAAYMERICVDFVDKYRPDTIKVVVTGFTPALLALVKVCSERQIHLFAYNYDREGRKFWEQEVI